MIGMLGLVVALSFAGLSATRALAACANPVACENALPGDPPDNWEVQGAGDSSIQGFVTSFSTNVGQTVSFKIDTPSTSYHIDILRLGYYGGDGARLIASNLKPSVALPQTQPACKTDSTNGLIDCGNWAVSASWTVPSTAVSGVYIAHLVRDDSKDLGGDSQIPFVVTNTASHSAIVVATSDATWEAYNDYGGNSLYTCTVACPPGNPLAYKAAYAVSYNRPFDGALNTDAGASYLYYAEYQMIRFLEENGYDVSYVSDSDLDRNPQLLENHKLFISSGHDEYWSANELTNVKQALASGVNLAFFSGNEIFWKTRWAASEDGSNTPYRTLISYKETHFNGPVDPDDPPTWTGAWDDPRFSPPGDGGLPSNALTGQQFVVNSGTADITVPYQYSKLRFWRSTPVAKLTSGQSLTLSPGTGTLGYEWDVDPDNGFRPAGEFDMSSTTVSNLQTFTDYGSTTIGPGAGGGTETHHLTLYKAPSGALVFGAGTVQWAWGLDNTNAWDEGTTDPSGDPPDSTIEQATVNLFADMGAQPTTLESGLTPATQTTNNTPPTSAITSPASGSSFADGTAVTITGTASDKLGVVAGVEVSTDGGTTWHPATITTADAPTVNWSYTWIAQGNPSTTIESRATDDSGNIETPSDRESVSVLCPCSLWGAGTPGGATDSGDPSAVSVGLKFQSSAYGTVTAIRFYKVATNTGTHIGDLWTASGTLLSSVTFSGESASGWQQAILTTPVTIMPNTTYVVSYYAPNGHYADSYGYFYPSPDPGPLGGGTQNNPPLHAVPNATSANGVFVYGSNSFPTSSANADNYWVDVEFAPAAVPGQVTGVSATAGKGSAAVSWSAPSTGGPVTSYTVTPYIGSTAQSPITISGSPLATSTTVSNLTPGTGYTFTVTASNPNGAGPASAQSSSVTPTADTAPSSPTAVSAISATNSAQVSWTTPTDNGGSTLTGYVVTPYIGSTAQTPLSVVNPTATFTNVTGLTNGTAYTFTVSATNGLGTSSASTASTAVTPEDTIFDYGTPSTIDSGDGSALSVGVKFTGTQGGWVTGVRFYKSAANTGTHVGSLWTASGTLLASGTFTNETGSGWQQVSFSSPVAINPGTQYVVSYYDPNGHYSVSGNGFASAVTNGPLTAVANGTSANGLYIYGGNNQFPSSSFNASNYWVDPMFQPMPSPGQVTGVSATAGKGSAAVSWSAPSTGGPVTSYTVTPYIGSAAQLPTTVSGSPPATGTTVSNLTPGTAYTFTVTGSNSNGSGPASAQSNSATPSADTVPSAPTGLSGISATSSAQLSWTAPTDNGGSALTGYVITSYIGSSAQTPTHVSGGSATSAMITGLTNGTTYTFTVSATNSVGTSSASTASTAVTPEDTIFDYGTPSTIDSGDGSALTVGVKFTASQAGAITGVRFYKSAANTGTHVGSLWTASGTLLASATFSNETGSGWQQVSFSSPVALVPGSTYVVSYNDPNGHYSVSGNGFASAVTNGPLTAVANGTSANGLYSYGDTNQFPSSSFNASNYWVDPMFQPNTSATAPGAPIAVTTLAATTSAQVSWTAPSSDGGSPLTGYVITPYIGSTAQSPIRVTNSAATSSTVSGLTDGTAYTFTVAATNGVGTGTASAASPSTTPEPTIFDFAAPPVVDSGDSSPITVGVKFTPTVPGTVMGIRFYKAPSNVGSHVGSLWDAAGDLLSSSTFTNETSSGWQQVMFSTPVAVTAGTTYVAAAFDPNGHYSVTSAGFSSGVTNGPLQAPASSTTPNGVYTYGGTSVFPSSSFNATNYWVDVLFAPSP